jgi:hypothetical protein
MWRIVAAGGVLSLVLAGCTAGLRPSAATAPSPFQNPVFLPVKDHEILWEMLVDAVDDYFEIEEEEPVRVVGNIITEGRIDTWPKPGATALEPWHRDSAGGYERLESTLQSIRRFARIRVMPDQSGAWVEVVVFKELEAVAEPVRSSAGAATFRSDTSLSRVVNPVGAQEMHEGWIPLGRDPALEQRMLTDLLARTGACAVPVGPR